MSMLTKCAPVKFIYFLGFIRL